MPSSPAVLSIVRLEEEAQVEEVQEQVVVEVAEVQELEEVEALGLVVAELGLVVAVLGLEQGLELVLEQEEGQAVALWSVCP